MGKTRDIHQWRRRAERLEGELAKALAAMRNLVESISATKTKDRMVLQDMEVANAIVRCASPCLCVRGPSSVIPSPSCPHHGHGPIPGRR